MDNLGTVLRKHRLSEQMTLQELAEKTGVSPSHLTRIESGDRYPSARILKKLAEPLGFEENELFTLAGFLTPVLGTEETQPQCRGLDPVVARALSREPIATQQAVIQLLVAVKRVVATLHKTNEHTEY